MQKKQASTLIYLIAFFVVFLAFCAFAIDATIVFNQRGKLQNATESTALAAASAFTFDTDATVADIETAADRAFSGWAFLDLKAAQITNKEVNIAQKQVRITTEMIAQPYFLAFLGVRGIKLNAISAAKSEGLPITSHYAGINWVTQKAAYVSDVISEGTNLRDTAVLPPLGGASSASLEQTSGLPIFELLDTPSQGLNLGPGGYVTFKLPSPIIDKKGFDIQIDEIGYGKEGYMVFVGLDINPENPYKQQSDPGDGIRWENITCSGKSVDGTGLGAYTINSTNLGGNQEKFYGSGYFNIGDSCTPSGGVSMAKYLRIVDDNDESAFVTGTSTPIMLYGESSSPTAGADIDSVTIFGHVLLINPQDYT